MATKQIDIPDVGLVTFYKRRGNRSIRLSITPAGEVRVSLPHWVPYSAGEQFVRSKASWIASHQQRAPALLQHGDAIGKAHRLSFEQHTRITRVVTRLQQNQIRVLHPHTTITTERPVQQAAIAASLRALRKEAEALLPQRLEALARQTGMSYQSVQVKQLKSRWGSCSSAKEITLNLFLMQLPWHLIDYVLMHELVHTRVMQHGAPFWTEFEQHLPAARRLRKEIATYQPILTPRALAVA